MSMELTDDQITIFESEVHHKFQPDMADMRNLVRTKNGQKGAVIQFPVIGKATTSQRTNYHTSIPASNVAHDPVSLTMKDWTVADYTDIFMNNKVNYDERQELVKSFSMSLKRRLVQVVIDALAAATITNTVAKNVSGSNDNLSRKMFKEARRLIRKSGVPGTDLTFMAHTNGICYLADDARVGSRDYVDSRVIVDGNVDRLWGFNIFEIPDMDEGGLGLSTNDRTNYAFHKMAVGLAVNMEPKIDIWWDGDKGAHKITGYLSANAAVVDVTGVAKITTDESVL